MQLEESLVLCPLEQQDWFSNRHLFDLVVIYDEDSRVNSYAGGPVMDRHQLRLRNLTVAIYDFAGYLKPLIHVPMLLVGGIRAWCSLVRESPLKAVHWEHEDMPKMPSSRTSRERPISSDLRSADQHVNELDLDAESEWLESLHSNGFSTAVNLANFLALKQLPVFALSRTLTRKG
jgi:hypothetical protein